MSAKNLLVELFVEELPPKSLKKLGESFAELLSASLNAQGLSDAESVVTAYATPRRLAVHVTGVVAQAADKSVAQKLMPVSVGLNASGQPTPALLKKLASLGADASILPKLQRVQDGKAETLFYDNVIKGATLKQGLQIAVDETLAKLPIAKVMSYQLSDGWTSVNFVRPAHGLIALYGPDIVPISALGLFAGRVTHGHRFEANLAAIVLKDADSYAQQLETEGAVIAGFTQRRQEIVRQLNAAANKEGLKPIEDEALLDEVTALVERPNVLLGQFEETFLDVPQECLILTMKANQKYFPLLDNTGRLTHKFLIVSNIRPADASLVIGGNERVVRPRLADAKFFFTQDRKRTLASRVDDLGKVVYHNKLGTQLQRVKRISKLAGAIAKLLGADKDHAAQAARLCKADLLTDMVGEFPELQGIMGRYYALHDGEHKAVSDAIEAHYRPRFAGDFLPTGAIACSVALADKLETLVGIYGVGQVPTGDKDPFGLRRNALGILRILIESRLDLSLSALVKLAAANFPAGMLSNTVVSDVEQFADERLRSYLRDQGFEVSHIEAVLAVLYGRTHEVLPRLEGVRDFAALSTAKDLAAANKRVQNIVRRNFEELGTSLHEAELDVALLQEPAERELYQAMQDITPLALDYLERGNYAQNLRVLVTLKPFIDDFFESVMVMCKESDLRLNRAALLRQLGGLMNQVADISKLAA
ncbi:MAG: glycine--tRNA ligase subunit beta [Gallionella sp.]